jgi:plasmid stabilization system protein ParE
VSDSELLDSTPLRQLEQLVRHLGDELSSFRRRAHAAESRVRQLEDAVQRGGDAPSMERLRTVEAENVELRTRLTWATEETRQLLARIRFLRQQAERPVGVGHSGG